MGEAPIPDDIEKALDRFFETAEQLAEIKHFEGRVSDCDYEPIFKGSVDLLDARDLIVALRNERDAILADREAQAKRVEELESQVSKLGEWLTRCIEIGMFVSVTGNTGVVQAGELDFIREALAKEGSDA